MGKHVKNNAPARTFWQALIPGLILLGVVIPQVVDAVIGEAGNLLPEHWKAWLLSASVAAAAVSAALARIMAIPGVNSILRHLGLSNATTEPAVEESTEEQ